MKFAIVGSGAMGSVFGAHLARAGHDVTLVDIRQDHMDAVAEDGLELFGPDGSETIRLAATTDAESLEPVEAMIFLCKGFSTAEAARSVAHALPDDGWAVTVQNGLGNDRVLAEVLGPERVVPGTTTVGAMQDRAGTTRMSPGTAAGQSRTHLGPPRGADGVPDGVAEVARALTDAGLPTEALADADVVIWTKLAMASSMGLLTAILRRTVQDVMEDETAYGLWRDMFDEIMAVAKAEGVDLDQESVFAHCDHTYRSVGHHTTSMAADVAAGRQTEIQTLGLDVAARGAEHGVPTPVVSSVGRLIRSLEASYDRAL